MIKYNSCIQQNAVSKIMMMKRIIIIIIIIIIINK